MKLLAFTLSAALLCAQDKAASESLVKSLTQVRRIYVAPLVGGVRADTLRELIIAGIDSQKLFLLTEDPERADAIMKGAADDSAYEETFDSNDGFSSHENGSSKSKTASSKSSFGGLGGSGVSGNESHHIKERKHEAYAAVRLCNREGDVLWSTTQESFGAKFRGASADVAAKIARQLALDVERTSRATPTVKNP